MNPGRVRLPPCGATPSATDRLRRGLLVVGILAAALALLSFVGTGGASVVDGQHAHGDGTDTTPPTLAGGSAVNATAFRLTIADNHDVDESSIQASDFLLEKGSIRNVSVAESGSNATVTVLLSRRLNEDDLTVALRSGASIRDASGNELNASADDSFVIVPNMDSIPPVVREFTVTNATGDPATIRIEANEPLREFHVAVGGPDVPDLDAADFEADDTRTTFERTFRPPMETGRLRVTLENATDDAGNTRPMADTRRILVDFAPPTPVPTIDLAASEDLSITFDARQSTDENGIARYRWQFGDGTTATGPRVTHQYVPGNYTVTLNVSDPYGNWATDTLVVNLTSGAGNVTDVNASAPRTGFKVAVDRPGSAVSDEALVSVSNAPRGEVVRVGSMEVPGRALVRHGNVSLDGLAVALTSSRSFDLAVVMDGEESVTAAAAATDTRPLAGFTVVNPLADEEIANATVRFSVDRSRLSALDADPGAVSLYRYHDGRWTRLPTTALNVTDGRQAFRADSPGFSRFAVLADAGPAVTVTDATLDTPEVTTGDSLSATATVRNSGTEAATFTAALEANGSVLGTTTRSIPAGETTTLQLESEAPAPGTYAVSVNGTSAGTLTVANDTRQFVVTNASLSVTDVAVDEPFAVTATIENRGRAGNFTAGLAIDGRVVKTTTRQVSANGSQGIRFEYYVNRSGTFPVTVNGTEAGTLTVGDADDGDAEGGEDGLLAPVFGILGFLPMGLLRPLFLFVVAPLVVIWGILKALAIYLGY